MANKQVKLKSEQLYKHATELFENYILNRDSFQGRYICPVTNKTYTRDEVKVGYIFSPSKAPKAAFNEANAHVEYKASKRSKDRLDSLKLNTAFKHGGKELVHLLEMNKNKNWESYRGIKALEEIIVKYESLPTT